MYEDNIAIVGTRKASLYGKKIAFNTARELSNLNINTVSGMANGIDSFAHMGSIKGDFGKTIAVLGNGLADNNIYPKNNLNLFYKILEKRGLIVSEYIIGTYARPYYFPERNRIISGLSDKILVVEANSKSGSMITVRLWIRTGERHICCPTEIFLIVIF